MPKSLYKVVHLTDDEQVVVQVITSTPDDAALIVGRILNVDGWNLHVERASIDLNPACPDMVCGVNATSVWPH